jgi:hypothetical protein
VKQPKSASIWGFGYFFELTPDVDNPSAVTDLLAKSSPLSRPSLVTVPLMVCRFRKIVWITNPALM